MNPILTELDTYNYVTCISGAAQHLKECYRHALTDIQDEELRKELVEIESCDMYDLAMSIDKIANRITKSLKDRLENKEN